MGHLLFCATQCHFKMGFTFTSVKTNRKLSKDIWITSSDNFASWGGGDPQYHTEDLTKLIKAVDYLSVHTYPMHDTHYNPVFWGVFGEETRTLKFKRIDIAMNRAKNYAISQMIV